MAIIKKMKVLIAIPIKDKKEVSPVWFDWMDKIYRSIETEKNIDYDIKEVEGKYYDEARNILAEYSLNNNYDYILYIDDDILMPMGGLQQLLNHKKDIVTFPAYAKEVPLKSNVFPNFYFFSLSKLPKNKLMLVDWVGTGCMLIKTEIFKKLDKPYFGCGTIIKDKIKETIFSYRTSEDEYFCRKCTKVGLKIWVDTSNICEHYCKKQNIFFPSLSTINDEGDIVYGGFLNVWDHERKHDIYDITNKTFGGINIQQTWSAIFVLEKILVKYKPDVIIEFGTGEGGLTRFFNLFAKVHTFDIQDVSTKNQEISYHICDIFQQSSILDISELIKQKPKVFVFCDNGSKIEELKIFAPYLKKGDLIFVHDYGIELTNEDTAPIADKSNLEVIEKELCAELQTLLKGWIKK